MKSLSQALWQLRKLGKVLGAGVRALDFTGGAWPSDPVGAKSVGVVGVPALLWPMSQGRGRRDSLQ